MTSFVIPWRYRQHPANRSSRSEEMLFSEAEIDAILAEEAITDEWPWNTNEEKAVENNIKDIVAEVRRKCRLLDKTEFNHYGSGYASFVDCWLYREDEEFRFERGNCYWGVVVLFSRLSHYYVIGEGQKTWEETSGSSYLPSYEFVDRLTHPATRAVASGVCTVLDHRGLTRAYANELSQKLPRDTDVPTILADPPFRHFDALFYWED